MAFGTDSASRNELYQGTMNNTIELKIEGMSCGHCVTSVQEALQGVNGVESADVHLDEGAATVTTNGAPTAEDLIRAVEEEGYKASLKS